MVPETLFGVDQISGSLSRPEGEEAGSYPIVQGTITAGVNYNITYIGGVFTIDSASLNITADDKVIYAGDPLPEFTFSYVGFVNGENAITVFGEDGPGYMLDPDYLGEAGSYQILVSGSAANYIITTVPGTMYVNPSGPGCFAVRPILRCIEELQEHASGYDFVAHFEYQNKNSTAVYVPIGEDNILIGEGAFDAVDQPVLFLSGGGSFDVYFNGEKLFWQVSSLESGRKTSIASEASSSSSRCKKNNKKSGLVSIDDEIPSADQIYGAYPNPVTGKLMIRLKEDQPSERVRVLDLSGRLHRINAVYRGSHILELDMTELDPGLYLIHLDSGDSKTIYRIMKE